MPVCHALLADGEFEQVLVCNARHVRNVPGRKTGLSDASGWRICSSAALIRYRRKLVEHRSSELQRLGNVLQDAGIKADSVASSITIKSVRAMVEALIDGERRPARLSGAGAGQDALENLGFATGVEGALRRSSRP